MIAFVALAALLSALPAAAQREAPFVDFPKGAFVDTGFKPDSNTRVVMDMTVQSDTEYWFGMWSVDRDFCSFAACNDGNGVFTAYGSANYGNSPCGTTGSVVPSGRHVLDFDKGVWQEWQRIAPCLAWGVAFPIRFCAKR